MFLAGFARAQESLVQTVGQGPLPTGQLQIDIGGIIESLATAIGNGSGLVVGTTPVTGCPTSGYVLYNSASILGCEATATSVFGRMGNVVGQYADYQANQIVGLGGMAFQNQGAVSLIGGTIDGIPVGTHNPKVGNFLGLGNVVVPITTGANTLTLAQYQNAHLTLSGTLTGNSTLTFPTGVAGTWDVTNLTTGNYTVTAQIGTYSSDIALGWGAFAWGVGWFPNLPTPFVLGQNLDTQVWSDGALLSEYNITAAATSFARLTGNIAVGQMNNGTNASSLTYFAGNGLWTTPTGLTPINIITLKPVACGTGTNSSCIQVSCVGGTGSCNQITCTASTGSCVYTPSLFMVRDQIQGCGQGGGGAGGGLSATGTAATGGGGGGGAMCNFQGVQITAADIATLGGSIAITMGTPATGTGGAGATTNGSAGTQGVGGANTVFGPIAVYGGGGSGSPGQPSSTASAGGAGGGTVAGGNASGTSGGSAGVPCGGAGGSTGASGSTSSVLFCGSGGGGSPTNGNVGTTGGASWFGAAGGGSGGGITSGNAGNNGGPGGSSRGPTSQTAATGGTSGSPNGGTGTTVLSDYPGSGGAGGYGNPSGNGGTGGKGGNAGGGGGAGGAARNGYVAGTGGHGGDPVLTITEYFS